MKPQFNQSKHDKHMQPLSETSMKTQAFVQTKKFLGLLFLVKTILIKPLIFTILIHNYLPSKQHFPHKS